MSFFGLSAYGDHDDDEPEREEDNEEEPSLRDVLRSVNSLSKSVRELQKQVNPPAGVTPAATGDTWLIAQQQQPLGRLACVP